MLAVRLHHYDERPVVEEVPEPEVTGAFTLNVNTASAPGATLTGTTTRRSPHVELSVGVCEPSR